MEYKSINDMKKDILVNKDKINSELSNYWGPGVYEIGHIIINHLSEKFKAFDKVLKEYDKKIYCYLNLYRNVIRLHISNYSFYHNIDLDIMKIKTKINPKHMHISGLSRCSGNYLYDVEILDDGITYNDFDFLFDHIKSVYEKISDKVENSIEIFDKKLEENNLTREKFLELLKDYYKIKESNPTKFYETFKDFYNN